MSTEATQSDNNITATPADELADDQLDQVSGGAATPPKRIGTTSGGTNTVSSSSTYSAIHG